MYSDTHLFKSAFQWFYPSAITLLQVFCGRRLKINCFRFNVSKIYQNNQISCLHLAFIEGQTNFTKSINHLYYS